MLLKLTTACLEALSALALNQPSCVRRMLSAHSSPSPLSHRVEQILAQGARKGVIGSSADEGRAVLAAHILIYVLGVGVSQLPDEQPEQEEIKQPNSGYAVRAVVVPKDLIPGQNAQGLCQGSVSLKQITPVSKPAPDVMYLSLSNAAELVGIRLPSSSSGTRAGTDVMSSPVMPFEELAELQHTIHDVLLPRMREPNAAAACSAVAQLYQLVAGPTGPVSGGSICSSLHGWVRHE